MYIAPPFSGTNQRHGLTPRFKLALFNSAIIIIFALQPNGMFDTLAVLWRDWLELCRPLMPLLMPLNRFAFGTTLGNFNTATLAVVIGLVVLGKTVFGLLALFYNIFFRPATKYEQY